MDKIDNILLFLDGLDEGREFARLLREERETLEKGKIPGIFYMEDIKEKFEKFLDHYELQPYHYELKIMLIIAQYSRWFYNENSRRNQRLTNSRVNDSPKKNNISLKSNLKELEKASFNKYNPNDTLNDFIEKFGEDTPIKDINPVRIHSINVTINGQSFNINSPEVCRQFEKDLSKLLYKYQCDGKLDELEKLPSKAQMKRAYIRRYLVPLYYYLKHLWPDKTQVSVINATIDFWKTFEPVTYDPSTFRKIIKGYIN